MHTQALRFRRKAEEYWVWNISQWKFHPGEKELSEWRLKRRQNKEKNREEEGELQEESGNGVKSINQIKESFFKSGFMVILVLPTAPPPTHKLLPPLYLKLWQGLRERIKQASLSYSFFMLLNWGSTGKTEWEATELRDLGNERWGKKNPGVTYFFCTLRLWVHV